MSTDYQKHAIVTEEQGDKEDVPLSHGRNKSKQFTRRIDIVSFQSTPHMVVTSSDRSMVIGKQHGLDVDYLLDSIPAQSCLTMDFPKENVKLAIDIYITRKGNVYFKAKDLCEILFEIEENPDKFRTRLTAMKELKTDTIQCEEEGNTNVDEISREEHFTYEQTLTCPICIQEEETMLLYAYQHFMCCQYCSLGFYEEHGY
ncbi:uncharacterized protein LOC132719222 [Ruditapes philippinarum]|uniref:uncharacterized protein LOC132719222 n=1 Tax=Ruditapes philippinarum TaxID=129788 RepID=UPI00295BD991|nr:uncharacterized protein LOC132719222 [Ruditapes philippinarum]